MIKKNIIKRKKKTVGTFNIFLIILVVLLSFSVGYSYFSSSLNIIGKAELGKVGEPEFPILQISESELLVGIEARWEHEGIYYYNTTLIFKNLDHDFKGWKIAIDVPANVDMEKSAFWCAAEVTIERFEDHCRLTFENYDWNSQVLLNGEINLGFNLAFSQEMAMDVSNPTINDAVIENLLFKENSAQYMA